MCAGRVDVFVIVDTCVLQHTVSLPPSPDGTTTLGQVSEAVWLFDIQSRKSYIRGCHIHPCILLKSRQSVANNTVYYTYPLKQGLYFKLVVNTDWTRIVGYYKMLVLRSCSQSWLNFSLNHLKVGLQYPDLFFSSGCSLIQRWNPSTMK